MNGGTVSAADGNYGIALAGSGDIRVTGGSISGSRAISYITLTGGVTFTGTLEVSGGTLEGNSSYSIIITGKTTISGGYFNSSTSCIDSYGGNVTVTGGDFASTSNTVELFIVGNSGKCAVRGGYFDRPINSSRTGNSYRNILNTDDTSEEYPFKVADSGSTYYINSTTPSSTTYTYYFNNISAASKHAQQTPYDVTIKLNGNSNPGNSKVVLTNENDKTITLDLNNKTITTNAESFITTTGELTITDNSANKGGTITSKKNNVITVDGTDADVEISNCNIITSYDVGADETYNYRTIYHNGGIITITDAEIEATNASAIYSGDGELTIDNAIITSKYYGLYVLEKTNVTITGDDTSFYSSDYSCIWSNAATVSIKIEGGYFYSTGENTAVTSSDSAIATFTFTGGYFSKVGTLTGSTGIDNIQPLATPATHSHSGVGELNYSYKYVEP